MKNNLIIAAVLALIIGGLLGFVGGMQYQKSQRPNFAGFNGGGQRGNFAGRFGQGGTNGVRPVNGDIISSDDKSITVKMQDGTTKIVILSDTTAINKAAQGSKADLKTGERVTAFGTANSDGSITAQAISIGGGAFRGASPVPTQ